MSTPAADSPPPERGVSPDASLPAPVQDAAVVVVEDVGKSQTAEVAGGDDVDRKAADSKAAPADARPEREVTFKDYIRIFSYAKKLDYFLMTGAVLASIGGGTTMPLMNVVFGNLVGSFSAFSFTDPNAKSNFENTLNRLALILFGLFLARFALGYVNKFCFRLIGIRMSAAIRLDYLKALFGQTIHVLDSMPPGSAAGTITGTANTLQLGISEKLGQFIEYLTMMITSIIVAFYFSWRLTLVTASVILFILLTLAILLPSIIKYNARQTKAETKATGVASEAFGSIRMAQACGAEERIAQRYAAWVHKAKDFGQASTPFLATQFSLVFFSLYGAFGLCFWYGSRLASWNMIGGISSIFIVLMSVMMMVMASERISTPLIAATKTMVAAAEFFVVIDAPRPETGHIVEPDVSATEDIIFSGIDFAYPSRPHVKVLDDLSLTIQAGKVTAIVGPSGSGKSTIVGLIEKWYSLKNDQYVMAKTIEKDKKKAEEKKKQKKEKEAQKGGKKKDEKKKKKKKDEFDLSDDEDSNGNATPTGGLLEENSGPVVQLKGSITTAGHDIDLIQTKWWRSQVGLVQQEPFLFNDTIEKNVMYGLIGSQWENEPEERKKELVREACAEAFADEFIDRLPDGLQTNVGDSGTKLSGGQRQRIAIARSIIKKPKILILDEATSALDVRGERIVQQALDRVSQGRTTITIAHRLSTIKTAHKILVLKKGRCVEEGTHESLLADPAGVYSGLVLAQQLSLGDDHKDGHDSPVEEEPIGDVLAREKSAAKSEHDQEAVTMAPGWVKRGMINSFGRLLAEQRSRWPIYGIALVFAMVTGSAGPLQAYLFGNVIDVFTLTGQEFLDRTAFWSLMWAMLAIAVGVGYFVLGYASVHLQHYICATYRQQYFRALLYQRIGWFDEEANATGSLTARVAGDPKQLEELLGMNMSMVYSALFNLVGSLIIAFYFGAKLTAVAFCITVPLGLTAAYLKFRYEMLFEKMYAEVFAESSKFSAEAIGAFRTVASLTLEDVIFTRYEKLLQGHVTKAFLKARFSTLIFALSDSITLACQALIFWYGGRLLLSGEYQAVNFFICLLAVTNGAEAAGHGLSFGPNAAQATAAANRIISMRESVQKESHGEDEKIPDTEGGIKIELRDVHFRYPTRNVSIFKGLNIEIEKGQFAALVGASGSGKTSIVALLERFYEPSKGSILFNDVPITEVNLGEYRKLLSLVAQEPTLFQGSVRDNILIGVDPATVTEQQLHDVCRDASIHDFIVSLPEGYDTDIGSKGVSLSGGQKQRVAIARALVRSPRVLLLDEATSSLDSDTEKLIQATFDRVSKGRTTIAVAHRLSTIQNADIIYVLGEGRVLEKGNHAELLAKRGVYWHMCHNQALDR